MERWVSCKECGHVFSSKLSRCPECGKGHLTLKNLITALLSVAFCGVVVFGMVLGFSDKSNGKTDKIDAVSSEDTVSTESKTDSKEEQSPTTTESKEEDTVSSDNTTTESKPTSKPVTSSEPQEPEESEEPVSSEEESPSYPIGTVIKNDLVYTTVPKFYLEYVYNTFGLQNAGMSFDDFAYTLSDEDKSAGYTRVIRNKDGSSTIVLPWSRLTEVKVEMLKESVKYIKDTENQKFIKKIGHTEHFDKFEIVLDTDNLNNEQKATLTVFGIYFLEYQYFTKDSSNQCDLVLIYPDSSKETLSFPNIIR